jgi:shikimate dehydrogenase/3-dehydroquinate dehydratase type I
LKLFVTIYEPTFAAAVDAIRSIAVDHDGVELRAEHLDAIDFVALRASTPKPVILTRRGSGVDEAAIAAAVDAGIDFVDVEWRSKLDRELVECYRSRIVLSHHDFNGMPEIEPLLAKMRACGCAHTKLAVTPSTLGGNLRLLRAIAPGVSVIGMGERGLYSRILAPFRGSEIVFVAMDAAHAAAPGQITAEQALEIYGSRRDELHATHVFAIAGDPAGHSLSPSIHNSLFREKGVDAAYTIASFADFREITGALSAGELRGLSVTAPFKQQAFAFAETRGRLNENARESGAVNTLVQTGEGIVGDNTDVDGFAKILREIRGRDGQSVAVIGAGGTARAALVALRRESMHATIYNRTVERAAELTGLFGVRAARLAELKRFDGEVVINTLPAPAEFDVQLRPGMAYIEAAYGHPAAAARASQFAEDGVRVFTGLDLLRAQAVRQNDVFVEAIP